MERKVMLQLLLFKIMLTSVCNKEETRCTTNFKTETHEIVVINFR
jgi:hypothetical protein